MQTARHTSIRSIAIIDPLGDFGIGSYTYELAEGIAANGVSVDVYTGAYSPLADLPRHHRVFPVLGGVLFKQRRLLSEDQIRDTSNSSHQLLAQPFADSARTSSGTAHIRGLVRNLVLPVELACHLKKKGYSHVWTQWPHMEGYGTGFWALCRFLGLRVLHTVHNVLPHEEMPDDRATCKSVYERSDVLVVHSRYAAERLAANFPEAEEKTIISRHGLYTIYPRIPEARERIRTTFGISPEQVVVLVFGGIRPYKNTDSVIQALKKLESDKAVLIVAGQEAGYPDLIPGTPLGRVTRIASQMGVIDRIRFIPGPHSIAETASIFEAADVLILPYFESYGSGALLLGMTFGKHILATPTGGMEEYLEEYPEHTMLKGPGATEILNGMQDVIGKFQMTRTRTSSRILSLEWRNITGKLLLALNPNSRLPGP